MSSSNPFAPKISQAVLYYEHAAYAGNAIGDILYGQYFATTVIDWGKKTALKVPNRDGHHSLLRVRICHSETPNWTWEK